MNNRELTGYPSIDKPWSKYYSDEAKNGSLPECTIYEYLWENNRNFPNDVTINYYGRLITYKEMFAQIDKTASASAQRCTRTGLRKQHINIRPWRFAALLAFLTRYAISFQIVCCP